MMKRPLSLLLWLLLFLQAFTQVKTPDEIWGALFTEVQMKRVLGDNKTFVDALPRYPASTILDNFERQRKDPAFNLGKFVDEHFRLPDTPRIVASDNTSSLKVHLEKQWDALTRQADVPQANSSLLALPKPYVVPGGRFREIYYWDSYFTMLGLASSNRFDLIENMLDNFAYLINTYGHIPNGNRTYYLSRSQPPYFALMVELLRAQRGVSVYEKYLPALEKEYAFFMQGADTVARGRAHRRIVKLTNGVVLNRYWDDNNSPRQESYFEDRKTASAYTGGDTLAFVNLRAGAESGWDFSSRWFADTTHLHTIQTTDILPVDLNCLLYAYEQTLANALKSQQQHARARLMSRKAARRKDAILHYCWNSNLNYFFDYNWKNSAPTNRFSLAGVMPLFVQIAKKRQANAVKDVISSTFLRAGGVVSTPYPTGEQWDAPNGWAPLQYTTIAGLMHYGFTGLASDIAKRWMALNEKVYAATGKMLEKYNVEDLNLESGGGEYPTQDGFGWTNGVYLKLHDLFRK